MSSKSLTLLASMLVTFALGSVHAFSVFLVSFEALLGLPRSEISLIYSFALVAITLAVLLGHRFYNLLAAWWLIFITCLIAAAGLLLAGREGSADTKSTGNASEEPFYRRAFLDSAGQVQTAKLGVFIDALAGKHLVHKTLQS